jgi:hypothetical protein
MRSALLPALLVALAACAGTRAGPRADGPGLTIAYGGDGRGAIGPCG